MTHPRQRAPMWLDDDPVGVLAGCGLLLAVVLVASLLLAVLAWAVLA